MYLFSNCSSLICVTPINEFIFISILENKPKPSIGEFLIVENGGQSQSYNEKIVKEYMNWDNIKITIRLGMGEGSFSVYTCDFTKDYIDINTDYRN